MRRKDIPRNQKGNGVLSQLQNLSKSFYTGAQEFDGEHHAVSMDKNNYGKTYQFVGPGTQIKKRIERGDTGLNDLDKTAMRHDLAYYNNLEDYKNKKINKDEFMNKIWSADDEFIRDSKNSRDDPEMGNLSSKLISLKKIGEKTHILPTTVFSGAGKKRKKQIEIDVMSQTSSNNSVKNYSKNDNPAAKLILETLKNEEIRKQNQPRRSRSRSINRNRSKSRKKSKSRSRSRNKNQIGGFALAPILIPLLASAAPEIIKGVYNYFKGQKGTGFNETNTEKQRDELLRMFL